MNVRFSSVFSVAFVGPQREAKPPEHAWPHWEPSRESVTEHDRLRAANDLNDRWSKEGRKAVIIYQLAERDLMPGAYQRSQPYFYLDGADYDTFKTHHDKEFPVHQQDELAADWNRGEWSKRFLRVCQALADRLIVNLDNQMKVEVPRWGRTTILHDPSLPTPVPTPVPMVETPLVPPDPLPFDVAIAGSTMESTTPVANPSQQKPPLATANAPFMPAKSSPTAA